MTGIRRKLLLAAAGGAALLRQAHAGTELLDKPTRGLPGTDPGLEERQVAGFERIDWDAIGELFVIQGPAEQLRIEAEAAVRAKFRTRVRDGLLTIDLAPGELRTRRSVRVTVGVKTLTDLRAQGSGSVTIATLRTPRLRVTVQDSSALQIGELVTDELDARCSDAASIGIARGRAGRQRLALDGSGDYSAAGLNSRDAEVSIDGSGDARIAVSERLQAKLSGSGDLVYSGPARVFYSADGAGRISRAGKSD